MRKFEICRASLDKHLMNNCLGNVKTLKKTLDACEICYMTGKEIEEFRDKSTIEDEKFKDMRALYKDVTFDYDKTYKVWIYVAKHEPFKGSTMISYIEPTDSMNVRINSIELEIENLKLKLKLLKSNLNDPQILKTYGK